MKTEDYQATLLMRLADPEYAVCYLAEVLENESQEEFVIALRDVLEARMANAPTPSTDDAPLRAFDHDLYDGENLQFATIAHVLDSIGLTLSIAKKSAA